MTLTATKAAFRGFRNGLKQVKMGDYEACIADLWAVENPGSDDPLDQVELTPEAKISLTLLPNIKMTPVDVMSAGDFICIFEFRFGRRGI